MISSLRLRNCKIVCLVNDLYERWGGTLLLDSAVLDVLHYHASDAIHPALQNWVVWFSILDPWVFVLLLMYRTRYKLPSSSDILQIFNMTLYYTTIQYVALKAGNRSEGKVGTTSQTPEENKNLKFACYINDKRKRTCQLWLTVNCDAERGLRNNSTTHDNLHIIRPCQR